MKESTRTNLELLGEILPEVCIDELALAIKCGAKPGKHGPGPIECLPFRRNDYLLKAKKKIKKWESGETINEDGFHQLVGACIRFLQLVALDKGVVWPPPQKTVEKKDDY